MHRDLKTGNVVLTKDGVAKICDFGHAKDLSVRLDGRLELSKVIGTPGYKAPEILNGLEYGSEVDIWSLGCIIHFICTR